MTVTVVCMFVLPASLASVKLHGGKHYIFLNSVYSALTMALSIHMLNKYQLN